MNKSILMALVILVLGVGYYFLSANQTISPADQAGTLLAGSSAIYVSDQASSNSVSIDFAVLEKPGYVVIYETRDEQPGLLLGQSALLTTGESKNITVQLSRVANDGEVLNATIYLDNGDAQFSLATDMPAKDSVVAGPVAMMFVIVNEAAAGESVVGARAPCEAKCRNDYGGSGSAGFDACIRACGAGGVLREAACPSPGPACPTPEIPECKNGRWVCIGPATGVR